jgi:hypothetical protein
MKYRLNSHTGTLRKTFHLIIKPVLGWIFHDSLPYSMTEY